MFGKMCPSIRYSCERYSLAITKLKMNFSQELHLEDLSRIREEFLEGICRLGYLRSMHMYILSDCLLRTFYLYLQY